MTQQLKRAGLYCRLSKDDDTQGDSESIKTQKALLSQYAKEHGFLVIDIYVDDGYSGLNFNRPDFNRLLDDIESGKLDIVITKDLSRLGRDHLKVGYFTEIYFPTKRIRYIAINDSVDTANSNNDIAALKNVMNEFYSRDSSRKIRSSIKARAKAGLYRCSFNPIGYKKAPDNHNRLIIDEETAWIVRRIFELASQGWGAHRIRTEFEKQKCLVLRGGSISAEKRTIPLLVFQYELNCSGSKLLVVSCPVALFHPRHPFIVLFILHYSQVSINSGIGQLSLF